MRRSRFEGTGEYRPGYGEQVGVRCAIRRLGILIRGSQYRPHVHACIQTSITKEICTVRNCALATKGPLEPPTPTPSRSTPYITLHFESSFPPLGLTLNATLAASVNASLTPRLRMAEHSKYLKAFIRLATSNPWL